jgi:tyrosinase
MFSNKVHGAEGPDEKPPGELVVNGPAVQGEISSGGERDRYTFTVSTTGTHSIETTGPTDTFVSLFGPDNESRLIAEDDDSGPGTLSLLVQNLTPGRYFLRVRHFNPASTGPYGITVKRSGS